MNTETSRGVVSGPFSEKSERAAIQEHYKHIRHYEDRLSNLRVEALRLALRWAVSNDDTTQGVVDDADAFYRFLKG